MDIVTGILGAILTIIVMVIPYRIKKSTTQIVKSNYDVLEQFKSLEAIETLKGVSAGYLQSKTCIKCSNLYSTDPPKNKLFCPHCNLITASNYVILKNKITNEIENMVKSYFEKNKNFHLKRFEVIE